MVDLWVMVGCWFYMEKRGCWVCAAFCLASCFGVRIGVFGGLKGVNWACFGGLGG